MKRVNLLILVVLLLCLPIFIGGWKINPSWQNMPIERNEHFIQTDTGATIYAVEKKLKLSMPQEDRKAVLLIHGVGVGYAYYDLEIRDYSMMEFLARNGFDVFAVDLRGYGKSTIPADGRTVRADTTADDMKSVVNFIKNQTGVKKVDIVGHSWGGVVALVLTGKYQQDIGKIVLIGMPYKTVIPGFQPIIAYVIEQAKSGMLYIPNELDIGQEQMLYSYDEDVLNLYHNIIHTSYPMIPTGPFLDFEHYEYSKYVTEISVPTLLIVGNLDEVVDLSDAVECLNSLGPAQKDLLFLGNAWHLTFLEKLAHSRQNIAVAMWLLQ